MAAGGRNHRRDSLPRRIGLETGEARRGGMNLKHWRAAALAIGLGACGAPPPPEAVRDVGAFLQAARGDDRMAFEARIDRPALRADLKGQLLAAPDVRALQDQLGDVGDVAVDRMLSPDSFRPLQAAAGELPAPGDRAAIRTRLKVLAHGRVCLRDAQKERCLLTFARQERSWKLVGMLAPAVQLRGVPDS